MALVTLSLLVDVQAGKLVANQSTGGAVATDYIRLTQGDTVALVITLLKPNGNQSSNIYDIIDPTGISLKVGVGTASSSVSANPSIYQNSFTVVGSALVGQLAIGTSAAATILGTNKSATLDFEIEATEADGTVTTACQTSCTLYAHLIPNSVAPSPPPDERYITLNEAKALFAALIGAPGATITLTSPNGAYGRIVGANDDGTANDSIITL